MAALKKRSVEENVGHFYYDWAQAKYKWTADDIKKNQTNKVNLNDHFPNENAKVQAKKNFVCAPVAEEILSKGFKEDDPKKPLQDRDINQPISDEAPQKPIKISQSDSSNQNDPARKSSAQGSSDTDETNEIRKGHLAMTTVLSSRLLKLRAAETLWHKDTSNGFVEYILRLKDDSVLVDVMPLLTSRVKENAPEEHSLSMGACLEMLPALERLLASKYEDYIVAALNMMREMIKRWWNQLKAASSKDTDPEHFRYSRSVNGLYMAMVSISVIVARLKKRRGIVGQKAQIVSRLLDLL
ncbi:KATNB1-like protein 1 [Nematostella vectensis]|uniref:KATNB1-like protein 1 n=1 Tax=Nematostella vectensis TaxID=45351 RepID=UPI0020776391|nr:KATNB1-like protein 1 [Nematostella vectensis]